MWEEEKIASFRKKLLVWYDAHKRDLPWRRTQDPYKIWISEIMLQQTRVDTVIPYYERFLDWFPTVADLAQAPEEKLLKAWEGLGSDIESPVNPRPEESPVKEFSAAYQHGTMDRYPIKAPKKKPVPVYLKAFIIKDSQGRYLLEKNEREGLLSGFWHFPLIEVDSLSENLGQLSLLDGKGDAESNPEILSFEQDYDLAIEWQDRSYPIVQHIFSHRKWQVQLRYGLVKEGEQPASESTVWLTPEEFSNYPFAKPQQKIWTTFSENEK